MESRRACSRKPCKQQFWKTFCLAYFKFGAAFRPSSLSLEDTHQLRQFSLFGKLFVDDDICRSSFLHLFDVQLVVRDILGDIVMSFSKLTDYPTLVAHRSVKLQIWGKMLIVKTRICMTARNSIQHPSKRYTADTSFGGGGGLVHHQLPWSFTRQPQQNSHIIVSHNLQPSQKPPKLPRLRPIPQSLRRHLLRPQTHPIPPVPPLIVKPHITPQQGRQTRPRSAKRSNRHQRGHVLGLIARTKHITTDQPHEIRQRHPGTRQQHAAALIRHIVVVPGAQQDGRRGRAPGHHEGGEVGEADLRLDVVDGGVDDEAGEC